MTGRPDEATSAAREREREREEDARDRALSSLVSLGQRLSASGTGGERFSERGPAMSDGEAEALFAAIESEIIPRLMLAHQPPAEVPASTQDVDTAAGDQPLQLDRTDHDRFLDVLMNGAERAAHDDVQSLIERGVSRETIFIELMGGAARRLGELWEADLCDFTDVTIGLCRLHSVLRHESDLFQQEPHEFHADGTRKILLGTCSGDQHVFGVVLVGEFFRREGWQVWSEPGASTSHMAGLLSMRAFDVLGLSVACSTLVEEVKSSIETFRKSSQNKKLRILVGGRLFAESPQLAAFVDADGLSCDARRAPVVAQGLLAELSNDSKQNPGRSMSATPRIQR